MATTTRLTVSEYLDRYADDPRWTELVAGEVVVNEPRIPHARIQKRLIVALENWSATAGSPIEAFPPADVRISDEHHFAPDVVVTRAHPELDDAECLAEMPLLCVEIRSPSTWRLDVGLKKAAYEAVGLPELWLVDDLARTVLVFRRATSRSAGFDVSLEVSDTLTSPQLPGLEIALHQLF